MNAVQPQGLHGQAVPANPAKLAPCSAALKPPPGDSGKPLQAQALLAGRSWVEIEHNGQRYRLQTTRAGKLILTK